MADALAPSQEQCFFRCSGSFVLPEEKV